MKDEKEIEQKSAPSIYDYSPEDCMRENPDTDRYDYDNRKPVGSETMYENGYWQ